MPLFQIDSLEDPRLAPYRALKYPRSSVPETFIAEGEKLVLRLLESSCGTESILCTAAAQDRLRAWFPAEVPTYVASTPLISSLIGFQFHRGVLACGRRPAPRTIESLCRREALANRSILVLCPEIRDPANLGTIIRTAAAFGAGGLVAGDAGTDPYSRRVLRTSMGAALRLPIVQTDDWPRVVATLHAAQYDTIATVLDPAAESLATASRTARVALFFGNEATGLPAEVVSRCTRRVILPMARNVDSLNVAVSAGIVLHYFATGD